MYQSKITISNYSVVLWGFTDKSTRAEGNEHTIELQKVQAISKKLSK
jgi:hypothetical protein